MTDASPRDDRSNQVITSLTELPRGGALVDLENEKLKMGPEAQDLLAVWAVTKGADFINGIPVWVVLVEGHEQDIKVYNYRRAIARAGYKIEKTVRADKSLVRALQDTNSGEAEVISERNHITDFYEEMVGAAIRETVSDIHIEKRKNSASIRMRKHGQLMNYRETLSAKFCLDLCTVIYNVLAESKDVTFMPSEYQAAAVNTRIKGSEVKLRYQSLPVYPDGFDVVLRVLPLSDEEEGTPDISVLGYSPTQVRDIMKIVAKPVGALIIAGTTGSGKSTTLKNLLMLVNEARGYRSKIYTIEDPPEYKIPHVSQIPVVRRRNEDYSKKSPFQDPLIATMRGDPDILMIGEIRDAFTGDGLKKVTQSGHQVMTTVHASSALGVVERLADFGITPSVMGSPEFINGLIYQKLMPLLCQNCAIDFKDVVESSNAVTSDLELAERLQEVANLSRDVIRLRNPKGCEKCKEMGVVGRTVCAEVIAPDFTLLRHFRQQEAIEAKAYWRSLSDDDPTSDNMTGKPVLEHALLKMRKGLVSPHDIEGLLGPVDGAIRDLEDMRRDKDMTMGNRASSSNQKGSDGKGWDRGY